MRIALVAGEASGDILGAGLITALAARFPEAHFEGVAGPKMIAAGCQAVFASDKLAVMGLFEILQRYRELRALREQLRQRYLDDPPDLFVAIDAPDFNLDLECSFRAAGIRTVHYVSPSVWAWREYRLRKIRRAVDLMLTLFPFEADYYRGQDIPVRFVGHPLADELSPATDDERKAMRRQLGLPEDRRIMAILPGSRQSEVGQLAAPFIETAKRCLATHPDLHFVVPLASAQVRTMFREEWQRLGADLPATLLDGQSQSAMAVADVVLLASGTATLEAMLLGAPMVAAYRLAPLSYWFARCLLKVERYTLPNLLAGEALIPEFIQNELQPEAMAKALSRYLDTPEQHLALQRRFAAMRQSLRRDASEQAAAAIAELLAEAR